MPHEFASIDFWNTTLEHYVDQTPVESVVASFYPPATETVAASLVQVTHDALPVVVAFGAIVSLITALPSRERLRPTCAGMPLMTNVI